MERALVKCQWNICPNTHSFMGKLVLSEYEATAEEDI
jgi:hypothetical protein